IFDLFVTSRRRHTRCARDWRSDVCSSDLGDREAYNQVEPFLAAISAKVEGKPGFAYLGPAGAGHYVKMVHNGIEYSDMQLISERSEERRVGKACRGGCM